MESAEVNSIPEIESHGMEASGTTQPSPPVNQREIPMRRLSETEYVTETPTLKAVQQRRTCTTLMPSNPPISNGQVFLSNAAMSNSFYVMRPTTSRETKELFHKDNQVPRNIVFNN